MCEIVLTNLSFSQALSTKVARTFVKKVEESLELSKILPIFARKQLLILRDMCTVTLEYNHSNALARRKLAALLATGLFTKIAEEPEDTYKPTPEEIEAHHKFIEDFLYASKINAAKAFAKHLL